MTVGELKNKLIGVDDDLDVLISPSLKFDGTFLPACEEESGVIQIADNYPDAHEEDEIGDAMVPMKNVFAILPHGFTDTRRRCTE